MVPPPPKGKKPAASGKTVKKKKGGGATQGPDPRGVRHKVLGKDGKTRFEWRKP